MNLIVDQGNTLFKIGLFENNQLINSYRFNYEDIDVLKDTLMPYDINRVLISSVVNQKLDLSFLKAKMVAFNHHTNLPIQNQYKTPETLGLDRIANAVAAWSLNNKNPSLVIDFGTCIKYDLVSEKGVYVGGNIAPGLNMRFKALHQFTDQLPLLSPHQNLTQVYGTDTETSLQCGVILAIKHEINGFINRYTKEFKGLTIFMTGGDLKYFDKTDKKGIFANQNLTLIGLNEILNHNA